MTNNEQKGNRFETLKGSKYEVADGQPDIRGWDVRDKSANHLGKVEELIFDVESRKVRYIVVKPDKGEKKESRHEVLVPIGLAELHNIDNDVFLMNVTAEQLTALPRYEDTVDTNMENAIRAVLAGGIGAAALHSSASLQENADEFYDHDHFNEDNLFKNRNEVKQSNEVSVPVIEEELNIGKQTVQTGGAYLRSKITEQPVEETVRLHEEQVHTERTPVDRPVNATDFDSFKEGIIELKEYAEVPVISKEARVVEEISIGKEVTERNEIIHDTIKKTEVDVENLNVDSKKENQ